MRVAQITATAMLLGACSAAPKLPPGVPSGKVDPSVAVWDYLDKELVKAAGNESYWKKEWRTGLTSIRREEFRLKKPYANYKMDREGLQSFLETGDLLADVTFLFLGYPVSAQDSLLGSVCVGPSGEDWTWVGSYHGAEGVTLHVAGLDEASEEIRVLSTPLGSMTLSRYVGEKEWRVSGLVKSLADLLRTDEDEFGTVAYDEAVIELRPAAIKRLESQSH